MPNGPTDAELAALEALAGDAVDGAGADVGAVPEAAGVSVPGATTIGTEEAEASILVLRDFCTRMKGAACERCALACPHGAVSFQDDGRPVIDEALCSQCGICLGICDAFTSTRVTMIDLHARMRRISLRGDEVVVACRQNVPHGYDEAPNVVVLPCLAALSPEFWAAVLAEGMPVTIAHDLALCADCPRAGEMGEALYQHAVATAEAWTERPVGFRERVPQRENVVRDLANPAAVDRRGAIEGLLNDVADAASGRRRLRNSDTLQRFYEQKERARARARLHLDDETRLNAFVPAGRTRKTMWPKRQLLLEALDRLPEAAPRVALLLSATDPERCDNQLGCARACPTGARFSDPESGLLGFDARYCIGCGLCVDACPAGAVEMVEVTGEAVANVTTSQVDEDPA